MIDLDKIGIFYRWMESFSHFEDEREREKAADVFYDACSWEDEELRVWGMFLATQKGLRSRCEWPVTFLARQQRREAASAVYGWYLARGMREEDVEVVRRSFFHVPWLLWAEEDFLYAGGREGFQLLQEQKFPEWRDHLGNYEQGRLGKFLFFAQFLSEKECMETGRRFPGLVPDLLLCRIALRTATGAGVSPDWFVRDILKEEPADFRRNHPWAGTVTVSDPNDFLRETCRKLYNEARKEKSAVHHRIVRTALETALTLWDKTVPASDLLEWQRQLSLLSPFECRITVRFTNEDSFDCEIRGTLAADGYGKWKDHASRTDLIKESELAGRHYARGEHDDAIFMAKKLIKSLGELRFENLHRVDKAPLKTEEDVRQTLAFHTAPLADPKPMETLEDLLRGMGKYVGLEDVAVIFEGDQEIIDSPIDLMSFGAAPLITKVAVVKSVTNTRVPQGFYLTPQPRVLLIASRTGGNFEGYRVPEIPMRSIQELSELLQMTWGNGCVDCIDGRYENGEWVGISQQAHCDILHIIAHGFKGVDQKHPYGILVAGAGGEIGFADGSALRSLLKAVAPRLVFLNCCHSGAILAGEPLFYKGLLAELLILDVPCLIGFRWMVEVHDSIEFCKKFYLSLKQSRDPARAVRKAREGLHPGTPQSLMWANPVILCRW